MRKQTEYIKKLIKESLLESAQRQRTNATALLGQREWTRLVGICNMEIRYQVSSMSEFRCGDLFRFISSVLIT